MDLPRSHRPSSGNPFGGVTVRPATAADAAACAATMPDVLPDRWRKGDNCRSLVAVDTVTATVVGHCRGIDSTIHPRARNLVLRVLAGPGAHRARRELLDGQISVSDRPLHLKVTGEDEGLLRDLADRGAVTIQLMPPWTRQVGPALRAWSAEHQLRGERRRAPAPHAASVIVAAADVDPQSLLELDAEHYAAQHATWSPCAGRPELLEALADAHDPHSCRSWDRGLSLAMVSHGTPIAAALVFGAGADEAAPEVCLLSRPYCGRSAWRAKLALLAEHIAQLPDGARFCLDSHVGMREEHSMIAGIPGLTDPDEGWTAVVAVPVPGAAAPRPLTPLPSHLIPDAAAWARLDSGNGASCTGQDLTTGDEGHPPPDELPDRAPQ